MIKFKEKGDYSQITKYLLNIKKNNAIKILNKYGKIGVDLLRSSTPVDSGLTSESWSYDIKTNRNGYELIFHNSNINDGIPIAILLQYGHATKNGGWVEGIDYINPSIKTIFEEMSKEIWKEVSKI